MILRPLLMTSYEWLPIKRYKHIPAHQPTCIRELMIRILIIIQKFQEHQCQSLNPGQSKKLLAISEENGPYYGVGQGTCISSALGLQRKGGALKHAILLPPIVFKFRTFMMSLRCPKTI